MGGVRNEAPYTVSENTDDDYALGTRLSEAEDSGLPREFSHESCQMSGTRLLGDTL